jgi:hypothetical protein
MVVGVSTLTVVAADVPKYTSRTIECPVWSVSKWVPVITTWVPPVDGPVDGLRDAISGVGVMKVYALVNVAVPEVVSTDTETVPMACVGVTALSCVEESTCTVEAGVPPNFTLSTTDCPFAGVAKKSPVTVTFVPPVAGPDDGETRASEGRGVAKVKTFDATPVPPLVAMTSDVTPAG